MNPPDAGAPPRQRPSGCLLVVLCLVSAGLLIFGGCSVILLSEVRSTNREMMILWTIAAAILALGLLCAVGAWRTHKRRRVIPPPTAK